MLNTVETLKLALDALEFFKGLALSIEEIERAEEAITAIKVALNDATPLAAPVQEPLAWIERDMMCDDFDPYSVTCEKPDIAAEGWEWVPLVIATTPPNVATPLAAQQEWRGLTDDEIEECWDGYLSDYQLQMIREMVAKLKEKNT